jgi:hypothetical protein
MALTKAQNTMAFGKVGIFGFAGTGKTYSSSNFAIGLHKFIGSKKPVAMFDTETGSDFLVSKFEKAGIEFLTEKSRSYKDLMRFMGDLEKMGIEIAIIDSISHVWVELQRSYLEFRKKNNPRITRLSFPDWAYLKEEWSKFTDLFLTSKTHIFLCGRSKYEYEHFEDEDGKKEITKVGTAMKAEVDFTYEPSLLLELKRIRPNDEGYIKEHGVEKDVQKKKTVNTRWLHFAEVLKDRTDTINGRTLLYPTFDDILAHFKALSMGGEHSPLDIERNSTEHFKPEYNGPDSKTQATIMLEEIEGEMITICGAGRSNESQKMKLELLRSVFGTGSWTQVTTLSLDALEGGLRVLRDIRNNPVTQQIPIIKEEKAEARAAKQ